MIAAVTLSTDLFHDIKTLVDNAKQELASQANSVLTLTYWRIGQRIRSEVLKDSRANYGQHIVVSLARQLEQEKFICYRCQRI